jgi:hypothetical protein
MFIFRTISILFSILGYAFAGLILYFGVFPITYNSPEEIRLTEIFECNEVRNTYQFNELVDTDFNQITSEIGSNLPIDLVSDIMSQLETFASIAGATTELTISYCDSNESSNASINTINKYLDSRSRFYDFGTVNSFVNSFNELPYAQLTNAKIDVASTFARSNVCNKAINQSELYLFTSLGSNLNSSNSRVALFTIKLKSDTNNEWYEVFTNNILVSGHYFKANLKCNG